MPDGQSQIILQFIDRIVDENIKSAESLVSLKFSVEEQRQEINEILATLKNGLRDDIKNHVSDRVGEVSGKLTEIDKKYDTLVRENEKHNERNKEIDAVLSDIRKKGMWFRGAVILISSVATIIAGFVYFSRVAGTPKQNTSIQQPQQNNSSGQPNQGNHPRSNTP